VIKRTFDLMVAATALLLLSPELAIVAIAIRLTSRGPVIFRQKRMGRGFKPFQICKFRSMTADAPSRGPPITAGEDPRITRVGRFLRETKIDELPQLFNVLKGEMSLVGPRPEVCRYVELFRQDYATILQVRPGITDLASIEYCDEAALLGQAQDPDREYIERVLPEKIRLAKEYVRRASFWFDLTLILRTFWALVRGGSATRKAD
jgi:lipopolysaccharide/colanic/teichoic acid biosynthesis glycosyltransferase